MDIIKSMIKAANKGVIFTNIFGKSNPDETVLATIETNLVTNDQIGLLILKNTWFSCQDCSNWICFECQCVNFNKLDDYFCGYC